MAPPRISHAIQLQRQTVRLGDCLIWTGAKSSDGYGQISNGRSRSVRAHRAAYQVAHGSIPTGQMVCHRCDTPLCVEPRHLFLGSPRENTQDMIAKGRKAIVVDGDHPRTKIPHKEREVIRARRSSGEKLKSLATEYGVVIQTISGICRGEGNYGPR